MILQNGYDFINKYPISHFPRGDINALNFQNNRRPIYGELYRYNNLEDIAIFNKLQLNHY